MADCACQSLCVVCGNSGWYHCSHCEIVRYCKRNCQKRHWALHKNNCSRALRVTDIFGNNEVVISVKRNATAGELRCLIETEVNSSRTLSTQRVDILLVFRKVVLEDHILLRHLHPFGEVLDHMISYIKLSAHENMVARDEEVLDHMISYIKLGAHENMVAHSSSSSLPDSSSLLPELVDSSLSERNDIPGSVSSGSSFRCSSTF